MNHSGKRILIIEDEQDLGALLAWALAQDGFEISLAQDGEEGLHQARSTLPDLVLLDLMLPKLDGYSVCRQLRSHKATASTPVLIISAFESTYSAGICHTSGATDFITKPFSVRHLRTRIDAALNAAA